MESFLLGDRFPNWLRVAGDLATSLSISQEDVASSGTVSCLGKQKHWVAWLPLCGLPTFIFTRLLFPDGGFNTPGGPVGGGLCPEHLLFFFFLPR